MNMLDDVILGNLVLDERDDPETDQGDINELSIYEHNKNDLISKIDKRSSRYELEFILTQIPGKAEAGFWNWTLRGLIKYYSLNYLKLYLADGFPSNIELEKEIKKLFFYLKTILIDLIIFNSVKKDIKREDLLEMIKQYNGVYLLVEALNYMDRDSYNRFLNTVFREIHMPFGDV